MEYIGRHAIYERARHDSVEGMLQTHRHLVGHSGKHTIHWRTLQDTLWKYATDERAQHGIYWEE